MWPTSLHFNRNADWMITVIVKTILGLKQIIGHGQTEVLVPDGCTLKKLISSLVKIHGQDLAESLFKPGGSRMQPHIRLLVNGRDIGFLQGLQTILKDGDEVHLLPPVAGG